MVKFAEAEKRGRGGDGSDKKFAQAVPDKNKLSRAMWESLKAHIMKERRRKKELEADAEERRMKREMENRKKQHAMTLEETRDQITKVEQKLTDLKAQKHDLVQQLKKVLNEEKQQQQQQQQQQQLHHQQHNYVDKSKIVGVHPYPPGPPLSIGGHPQMMFPSAMVQGRGPTISTLYKVATPPSQPIQNMIPTGSVKRSRSPSPQPPQSSYHTQPIPYVFKSLPVNQTSVVPVTLPPSRGSFYHGSTPSTHVSSSQYTSSTQAAVVAPYLTTPAGPPPPLPNPPQAPTSAVQTTREEKHLQSIYLPGGRVATSHVTGHHPQLDHKGKSLIGGGGSAPSYPPSPAESQDKFYVRPHLVLHTVPVQQTPSGGSKGSGISSSFAVRGQPPVTSQTQNASGHNYSGHSINLSRTYF